MIYLRGTVYKCEKCGSAVDLNFFGVSCLLGPPLVVCHWCGEIVATDRMEWNEMPRAGKLWFFGISLFYVAVVGFLGAISVNATVQFIQKGTWTESIPFSQPTFWLGAAPWAAFVVLLQLYRVSCSRHRGQAEEHKPLERSFRSFQIGVQFKCVLLLILIPAVAWFGRWMWDRFGG